MSSRLLGIGSRRKPELRCLIRIQGDKVELDNTAYNDTKFYDYLDSIGIRLQRIPNKYKSSYLEGPE